jgi:hypothetical protein
LIDRWGMVDLELFRTKLNKNWVVTFIPNNKNISVFELGHWTINNGEWLYNKETFYDYIHSLVEQLNPRLENLYNCHGGIKVVTSDAITYSEPDSNKPGAPFYQIGGKSFCIVFRDDDNKLYLSSLSIFRNGQVEITNLPKKKLLALADIRKLIDDQRLLTNIPIGERVHIVGLGSL